MSSMDADQDDKENNKTWSSASKSKLYARKVSKTAQPGSPKSRLTQLKRTPIVEPEYKPRGQTIPSTAARIPVARSTKQTKFKQVPKFSMETMVKVPADNLPKRMPEGSFKSHSIETMVELFENIKKLVGITVDEEVDEIQVEDLLHEGLQSLGPDAQGIILEIVKTAIERLSSGRMYWLYIGVQDQLEKARCQIEKQSAEIDRLNGKIVSQDLTISNLQQQIQNQRQEILAIMDKTKVSVIDQTVHAITNMSTRVQKHADVMIFKEKTNFEDKWDKKAKEVCDQNIQRKENAIKAASIADKLRQQQQTEGSPILQAMGKFRNKTTSDKKCRLSPEENRQKVVKARIREYRSKASKIRKQILELSNQLAEFKGIEGRHSKSLWQVLRAANRMTLLAKGACQELDSATMAQTARMANRVEGDLESTAVHTLGVFDTDSSSSDDSVHLKKSPSFRASRSNRPTISNFTPDGFARKEVSSSPRSLNPAASEDEAFEPTFLNSDQDGLVLNPLPGEMNMATAVAVRTAASQIKKLATSVVKEKHEVEATNRTPPSQPEEFKPAWMATCEQVSPRGRPPARTAQKKESSVALESEGKFVQKVGVAVTQSKMPSLSTESAAPIQSAGTDFTMHVRKPSKEYIKAVKYYAMAGDELMSPPERERRPSDVIETFGNVLKTCLQRKPAPQIARRPSRQSTDKSNSRLESPQSPGNWKETEDFCPGSPQKSKGDYPQSPVIPGIPPNDRSLAELQKIMKRKSRILVNLPRRIGYHKVQEAQDEQNRELGRQKEEQRAREQHTVAALVCSAIAIAAITALPEDYKIAFETDFAKMLESMECAHSLDMDYPSIVIDEQRTPSTHRSIDPPSSHRAVEPGNMPPGELHLAVVSEENPDPAW